MTAIGQIELVVPEAAIDGNGHVNNVQYLHWMQQAAMAHSAELGWAKERYAAIGRTWIIRSHTIEYHHSAYLGETIRVLTWVADLHKIRTLRKYKFLRPADNVTLALAATQFIFCDRVTGKPVTIPAEVQAAYTVVAPDDEP